MRLVSPSSQSQSVTYSGVWQVERHEDPSHDGLLSDMIEAIQ